MAFLIKLVYLLIVLSIAVDFINLGGDWFNTHPNSGQVSVHSSSLLLPGASGWAAFVTKSAIKAAKKKAKNQAKKKGNARNKNRKTQGGAEHTKNSRKSTKDKHQKGQARKNKEQQRGRKG